MNLKGIADAIAGRFTGVTATVGATTESFQITPTADLANGVSKTPALLVDLPTGSLEIGLSRRRQDRYSFPVLFLRSTVNSKARTQWMYAWADALRDRVEADMDLGLSYVSWAKVTDLRMELAGEEVGGVIYDVIELTVEVRVDEVVGSVAV